MALTPFTPPVTGHYPLPGASPGPYKSSRGPPATPTPSHLALALSLALLRSRVELAPQPNLRR